MSIDEAGVVDAFGYKLHHCKTAEGDPRIGMEIYDENKVCIAIMHMDPLGALRLSRQLLEHGKKGGPT